MFGEEIIYNTYTDSEKQQILHYLFTRGQVVNQIKVFDNLWNELMQQPFQRSWLRLLRINLRRLRSALILLEPLLPLRETDWLDFLHSTAEVLGKVRDYDVVYQDCEKYAKALAEEPCLAEQLAFTLKVQPPLNLSKFKELVQQQRDVQAQAWLAQAQEGWIGTGLKEMESFLEVDIVVEEKCVATAKHFLQKRLQIWDRKLQQRLLNLQLTTPMKEMHRTRIKVKRFRYAYEVYMEPSGDVKLLESLKAMQDILGSLHDGEHNLALLQELVQTYGNDIALQQEFLCYKAWREQKMQVRLASLMDMRDQLLEMLKCSFNSNADLT